MTDDEKAYALAWEISILKKWLVCALCQCPGEGFYVTDSFLTSVDWSKFEIQSWHDPAKGVTNVKLITHK